LQFFRGVLLVGGVFLMAQVPRRTAVLCHRYLEKTKNDWYHRQGQKSKEETRYTMHRGKLILMRHGADAQPELQFSAWKRSRATQRVGRRKAIAALHLQMVILCSVRSTPGRARQHNLRPVCGSVQPNLEMFRTLVPVFRRENSGSNG
jgi:hypothetical protein